MERREGVRVGKQVAMDGKRKREQSQVLIEKEKKERKEKKEKKKKPKVQKVTGTKY